MSCLLPCKAWPVDMFMCMRILYIGAPLQRRRSAITATSQRHPPDIGPTSERRRSAIAATSARHRPDVGATSQRHRSDIDPTSARRHSAIAATSARRRSDVAAPSQPHRPDIGSTSLRHVGNALLGHHIFMLTRFNVKDTALPFKEFFPKRRTIRWGFLSP